MLGLANVYNWGHKIGEVLATVNGALAIATEIGDTAGQAGCHALRGEARGGVYGPSSRRCATRPKRCVSPVRSAILASWRSASRSPAGSSSGTANTTWRSRISAKGSSWRAASIPAIWWASRSITWATPLWPVATTRARWSTTGVCANTRRLPWRQALPGAHAEPVRRRVARDVRSRRGHSTQYRGRRDEPATLGRGPSRAVTRSGSSVSRNSYRGNHGSAERAFREAGIASGARQLGPLDVGELAVEVTRRTVARRGQVRGGWTWASRALEAATQCRQRKHASRAMRLQGAILAAQGAARGRRASHDGLAGSGAHARDGARILDRASSSRPGAHQTWPGSGGRGPAHRGSADDRVDRREARHPEAAPELLGAEPVADVFRTLGRTLPRSG